MNTSRTIAVFAGLLWAAAALSALAPASTPATQPRPLKVAGEALRFVIGGETLIAHVNSRVNTVMAGPDGRLWAMGDRLGVRGNEKSVLDSAKSEIQKQFESDSPTLSIAVPVLMETSGRCWFMVQERNDEKTDDGTQKSGPPGHLLGYDGRTWIERKLEALPETSRWSEPTGGPPLGDLAIALGQRLYFLDREGVHSFDGKDWTYHKLVDASQGERGLVVAHRIVPLPGGASFFVIAHDADAASLWLCRPVKAKAEARWDQCRIPREDGTGVTPLDTVIFTSPRTACILRRFKQGALELALPPAGDAKGASPDALAPLIARLGDNDFEVREKATSALRDYGPWIQSDLQAALKKADDAEVKSRLESLIARPALKALAQIAMGAHRFESITGAYADETGNMVVSGRIESAVKGGPSKEGTVIQWAKGGTTHYDISEFPMLRSPDHAGRPLVVAPGQRIWFPGNFYYTPQRELRFVGPTLVDFTGQRVAAKTDCTQFLLHAIAPDGTLFVSYSSMDARGPWIIAIRPKLIPPPATQPAMPK